MMLETHMKLCMTEPDFVEKFICPQISKNGPKTGFLEFKIWSLIFAEFVNAQIPYLGKLFLRYGPKCSHPIKL